MKYVERQGVLGFIFLYFVCYVPFFFYPLLRLTGDEKTYIAQTLEMIERSAWFTQTMAGDSYYYKGPLLFWLSRMSILLFGQESMFPFLFVNWLCLGGALWTLYMTSKYTWKFATYWSQLLVVALGLSVSSYTYIFAAQMEILLISLTTIVFCLASKTYVLSDKKNSFLFQAVIWILIGVVGWVKSPINSVLLAVSHILCSYPGNINPRFVLATILGTLFGFLGYIPTLVLDGQAFWETYILVESFGKVGNGVGIWTALVPVFTFLLMPFMAPALLSYVWTCYLYFVRSAERPVLSRQLEVLRKCALLY
ncbi:MAG: hypothetical protein OXT67_09290, partial [Zetaproteobacteria bacterium]|nr:hypothetical protein [Zetaproteobacteria bacterium]